MKWLMAVLVMVFSLVSARIVLADNAFCPSPSVLEVVVFKVKPQYTLKQIKLNTNRVTQLLKTYQGFQARQTMQDVTNKPRWLDLVCWANQHDALAALKTIEVKPVMQRFNQMIASYKMYHFKS